MANVEKGDYVVITMVYEDKYFKDDVFIVEDITSGYQNTLQCRSLFRNAVFPFTNNKFLRKITPSAAQKRIKNAIKTLETQIEYMKSQPFGD
jgi:hypothetical protein